MRAACRHSAGAAEAPNGEATGDPVASPFWGYGECQLAVQVGAPVGGVPVPWKPNSVLPPAGILPL